MLQYKIVYGYTRKGREKRAYYTTMAAATEAAKQVFEATGVVLGIEEVRPMKLAPIANRVARDIYHRPINPDVPQQTTIRDACDTATGSDLSCSMLDRLCDMVTNRLRDPYRYGLTS